MSGYGSSGCFREERGEFPRRGDDMPLQRARDRVGPGGQSSRSASARLVHAALYVQTRARRALALALRVTGCSHRAARQWPRVTWTAIPWSAIR